MRWERYSLTRMIKWNQSAAMICTPRGAYLWAPRIAQRQRRKEKHDNMRCEIKKGKWHAIESERKKKERLAAPRNRRHVIIQEPAASDLSENSASDDPMPYLSIHISDFEVEG